jgi:hypothetical protein
MKTRGMLHVAAGFEGNGFVGRELVASACVPGAFQHNNVPVLGMEVIETHRARGNFTRMT